MKSNVFHQVGTVFRSKPAANQNKKQNKRGSLLKSTVV